MNHFTFSLSKMLYKSYAVDSRKI